MQEPIQPSLTHPADAPPSTMRTEEPALVYARKGWRVLPLHSFTVDGRCTCGLVDCRNSNAHPIINVKEASNDPTKISRWWRLYPYANIGIATGHGLLVIEIDSRCTRTLAEIQDLYTLPETATVQIGNSGWQLYFTYSKALLLRNSLDRLETGIATWADNGYVIAPPSRLKDGVVLTWLNTLEPAPVPAVLLPALLNPRPAHVAHSLLALSEIPEPSFLNEQEIYELAGTLIQTPLLKPSPIEIAAQRTPPELSIPSDQRTISLANIAGTLRRLGASDDVLKIILVAFNEIQCKPPLSYPELLTITDRVLRWRASPPPTLADLPATPSSQPQDIAELLALPGNEPQWIIPDLLPEGVTLLTGKPRLGKSWLALELALATVTGTRALGKFPVRQGEVLFLGLEETVQRMVDRTRLLLHNRPTPYGLYWTGDWSGFEDGGLADLEDWLQAHPSTCLVVIDTLAHVHSQHNQHNPKWYNDIRREIMPAPLKIIAEHYHIAILLVQHLRKPGDPLDEIQTLIPVIGPTDNTLVLLRERGQTRANLLMVSRFAAEQKFTLQIDPQTFQWRLLDQEALPNYSPTAVDHKQERPD